MSTALTWIHQLLVHPSDSEVPSDNTRIRTWRLNELKRGNEYAWCDVECRTTLRMGDREWEVANWLAGCSYDSLDDLEEDLLSSLSAEGRECMRRYLQDVVRSGEVATQTLQALANSR